MLFTSATAEPVRGLVRIEIVSGAMHIDGRARLSDAMELYVTLGRAIATLVEQGGEPVPLAAGDRGH